MIYVSINDVGNYRVEMDNEGVELTPLRTEDIPELTHMCVLEEVGLLHNKSGKHLWKDVYPLSKELVRSMSLTLTELRNVFDVNISEACEKCGGSCCTDKGLYERGEIVDINLLELKELLPYATVKSVGEAMSYHRSGVVEGNVYILELKDGKCPALNDNGCSLQDKKPLGCRQFNCLDRMYPSTAINLTTDEFYQFKEKYWTQRAMYVLEIAESKGVRYTPFRNKIRNYLGMETDVIVEAEEVCVEKIEEVEKSKDCDSCTYYCYCRTVALRDGCDFYKEDAREG